MKQDKRDFLTLLGSTLAATVTSAPVAEARAQLPPLRTVDWILDSATGQVRDANAGGAIVGAWTGAVLPGDRFPASRLAVLRVIGNSGEDFVLAVEIGRPEREGQREPRLSTAFALPQSLWQPVNNVALVVGKPGGWLLSVTLVRFNGTGEGGAR